MKLLVYKGFDASFLEKLSTKPLLSGDIEDKINIYKMNRNVSKKLRVSLLDMEPKDEAWITYEEYTLIKGEIDDAISGDGLELVVIKNNLFPDYYMLPFEITDSLFSEINDVLNGESFNQPSEECEKYIQFYNTLLDVDGIRYGSFYNYELESESAILSENYYDDSLEVLNTKEVPSASFYLNEDVATYLRDFHKCKKKEHSIIGVEGTNGIVSKRIQRSLQAYCRLNNIKLVEYHEKSQTELKLEAELIDIAKNVIKIDNFQKFRNLKFYKNPDIDSETYELSQIKIIEEIIEQAENAYASSSEEKKYHDILMTAPTGAGKSVIFQIPAIYLAQKYKKLTIIIEPVKALMQDQKDKLTKKGFTRVETFNSDLITQVEKEAVLRRIREGEVDLLYMSPETLLSYSLETIIGERELGLLIVDEAHIVTTWGMGFRPDYWYLGGYINKLRNTIKYGKTKDIKTHKFPICAFTATAINGGVDDSVDETIISLYMENPIRHIGYVRRDDIDFEIERRSDEKRLSKEEYENSKADYLNKRIKQWVRTGEKTIVYFPYAKQVEEAKNTVGAFATMTTHPQIVSYTGRNVAELTVEEFNDYKREVLKKFHDGDKKIVFATKAFGMGIDVDDVNNVYHYAISGNLCDYVQEIGRAARKAGMRGKAIMDSFKKDENYSEQLFGMSQILPYQLMGVLQGIYDIYRSKNDSRRFLISPESFTYLFNGKNKRDESKCINKLKTCLLMIEKDFYDKYSFKVLISRPQSMFTKAYVCIDKKEENKVLKSKYRDCFKFVKKGRYNEMQPDGTSITDLGDVYSIDLKKVWEENYQNVSFASFKYWYFNNTSKSENKIEIMPEIRQALFPRQKIKIEARHGKKLSDIRAELLSELSFVADVVYKKFGKNHFSIDDLTRELTPQFGVVKARIVSNSILNLIDPERVCVKHQENPATGESEFFIQNGTLNSMMRKCVTGAPIVGQITKYSVESFENFISITNDNRSSVALKLLSAFDLVTYEITGGEEPEIFIRINDPQKIKDIVLGNKYYENRYLTLARRKHVRDVEVLNRFISRLGSTSERWDFIEDYFLGKDVLELSTPVKQKHEKMTSAVDKGHSYDASLCGNWEGIKKLFPPNDCRLIEKIEKKGIQLPEYISTKLKNTSNGKFILMSWPKVNAMIVASETSDIVLNEFAAKGWTAYRLSEINFEELGGLF